MTISRAIPALQREALVGAHTHAGFELRLSGRIQSFAIFFEPFGLWQLFRLPNSELIDVQHSGRDALGQSIHQLWQQMAECRSFRLRVAVAESFLLQRARSSSAWTDMMNAAAYLFRNRGAGRVSQLATDTALSLRHFERRFAEATGMPPKLFARITRFQSAVDLRLRAPHLKWLTVAHDLGYCDQMHMIRDFHSLSGTSPNQMLLELGDTKPPALAGS